MSTGFDDELLFDELNDILDIDMTDFGFDIDKIDLFKENERHKTNDAYNLDLIDFENSTNDFWQMPVIQNDNFIPDDIIGFNYAKSSDKKNTGIHFYLDDYQFERIWNDPDEYVELLKYYTTYNKDCSIHIHFGGFPINMECIDRLVKCWGYFQNMLLDYIPRYSYQVERYKSNGKAYNKPLSIRDLRRFIYQTTGNIIESDSDLYLPNEYDRTEDRKWNVTGRYYNMNIMHLVSGNEHKTVEFRFIRPTYHYDEIKTYILVLGGFLNWVMRDNGRINSIPQMIQEIDSPEISKVV